MLQREAAAKSVLLLSNSIQYGHAYLDHAEEEIRKFFAGVRRILFVPFAMFDHAAYAEKNRLRFEAMGFDLQSIHTAGDMRAAVENSDGIFIGGGNTFRLLKALYDNDLLQIIRDRVAHGMLYMGSSAGTVVACPAMKTTNDMPIVRPPSFDALGLVSFQINAHYLDAAPGSTHMGETREERLVQYLEDNHIPVLALREGAMVRLENGVVHLKGSAGACLFQRGSPPQELRPGARLSP